jgi:hypothetical protein
MPGMIHLGAHFPQDGLHIVKVDVVRQWVRKQAVQDLAMAMIHSILLYPVQIGPSAAFRH